MKKILKNNNGFSLLELIIALAILSIIIIPISSLFINSAKATNSANDKMIALSIAQGEMERIKLQDDLEDIESQYNLKDEDITNGDKKEIKIEKNDDNYEDFSCEINIEEVTEETAEKSENAEENITQAESEKKILQEIGINPSKLKEDDYYILIVNNIATNYILTTQFKNSEITQPIDLESAQKQKETISVFIKDSNTEINKEKQVKIEVSNESHKPLEIYTEKESNISIINKLGEVKVYKNYSNQNTTSKLYKINIEVYKDDKDNPIEKIESYKNIVQ